MTDISKAVSMYRIVHKDQTITECYIGSTGNLPCRKNNHYNNCIKPNKKEHNKYCYIFIRENGGWDNWEIIEIEKYHATNLEDRRRRERYWVEFYNASLNKNTPYLSNVEIKERRNVCSIKIMKNRYTTDPIFREKRLKYYRDRYHQKKNGGSSNSSSEGSPDTV